MVFIGAAKQRLRLASWFSDCHLAFIVHCDLDLCFLVRCTWIFAHIWSWHLGFWTQLIRISSGLRFFKSIESFVFESYQFDQNAYWSWNYSIQNIFLKQCLFCMWRIFAKIQYNNIIQFYCDSLHVKIILKIHLPKTTTSVTLWHYQTLHLINKCLTRYRTTTHWINLG